MLSNTLSHFFYRFSCYLVFCICAVSIATVDAEAAKRKKSTSSNSKCVTVNLSGKTVSCIKSPPSSLVVDTKTGKVLHSEQAHESIHPASLTKMMTLYLTFEALEEGKLSMNQTIPVSAKAANMPPCKLWLKPGDRISIKDAVIAMVVKSANDASVAISEFLCGSEAKFAALMTKRAQQLGMTGTQFYNASGWHHSQQKTTAHDLAKLAMAIKRDFPQYYPLFSRTSFVFRGRNIHGHNPITAHYPGATGLKTGFNNPSGVCIVTTATRNNKDLVAVVTGSPSGAHRNNKVVALLDRHFGVAPTILTKQSNLANSSKVRLTKKVVKKKYRTAVNRYKPKSA